MGTSDDGKGELAHREGIRQKHWSVQTGAARSAADLRQALPCFGRGVGVDPILLGHVRCRRPNATWAASSESSAVNDRIGIEPDL